MLGLIATKSALTFMCCHIGVNGLNLDENYPTSTFLRNRRRLPCSSEDSKENNWITVIPAIVPAVSIMGLCANRNKLNELVALDAQRETVLKKTADFNNAQDKFKEAEALLSDVAQQQQEDQRILDKFNASFDLTAEETQRHELLREHNVLNEIDGQVELQAESEYYNMFSSRFSETELQDITTQLKDFSELTEATTDLIDAYSGLRELQAQHVEYALGIAGAIIGILIAAMMLFALINWADEGVSLVNLTLYLGLTVSGCGIGIGQTCNAIGLAGGCEHILGFSILLWFVFLFALAQRKNFGFFIKIKRCLKHAQRG